MTDIRHDLKMFLGKRSRLLSLSCPLLLPGLLFLTNKSGYFKYPFETSPLFCEAGNEGSERRCRQDPKTSACGSIPMLMKSMDRERQGGRSDYSGIDDVESYVDHVLKFSLAGIHAIREEAEKRKKRIQRGIHENQ